MKLRPNKDLSIAFKGLNLGLHHYEYVVNNSFFEKFENSPVKAGNLKVQLDFYKRLDHFQCDFEISGTIASVCDRCTADIDLPLDKSNSYIVKMSDEAQEDDLIYISLNTQILDLSTMIYESIILGIPLIRTYDCDEDDPLPCNLNVLKYLNVEEEQKEESAPEEKQSNPIWDTLNDLKFKDN